jgi:hypothetical protein
MKMALLFISIFEVTTGAALLIVPSLVGLLLFGVQLTGIAITVARVTGIALIGLGVACWSGTPLLGMLIYRRPSCCISPSWASWTVSAASCCGRRSSYTPS